MVNEIRGHTLTMDEEEYPFDTTDYLLLLERGADQSLKQK